MLKKLIFVSLFAGLVRSQGNTGNLDSLIDSLFTQAPPTTDTRNPVINPGPINPGPGPINPGPGPETGPLPPGVPAINVSL